MHYLELVHFLVILDNALNIKKNWFLFNQIEIAEGQTFNEEIMDCINVVQNEAKYGTYPIIVLLNNKKIGINVVMAIFSNIINKIFEIKDYINNLEYWFVYLTTCTCIFTYLYYQELLYIFYIPIIIFLNSIFFSLWKISKPPNLQ